MVRLEGHSKWVRSVGIGVEGRVVATGSYDATARVWTLGQDALAGKDAKDYAQLHCLPHPGAVMAVAVNKLSGEETRVVSGCEDGVVRVWSASSGELLATLTNE